MYGSKNSGSPLLCLQIWLELLIKMQIDRKSKLAYYWKAPVGPSESASNFGNYMSRDVSHFPPKFVCENTWLNNLAFLHHLEISYNIRGFPK
jgi:hypothetical protein